jgi:hypothetical protein
MFAVPIEGGRRSVSASRWLARGGVFAISYLLCLVAYAPIRAFPLLGANDLGIAPAAHSASWGDFLRARVVWQIGGEQGRQFRPLPVLTYRLDDLFVGTLSPGHRWFDFAVLAALGLACFWVLQRLLGSLSLFETALLGLLCASVPVSFAGSDPAVSMSSRVDSLLALFLVILVGALLTLLPVRREQTRPGSLRAARPALLVLVLAVLGCGLSKEYGPMIALVGVVLWVGVSVSVDRGSRRVAVGTLTATVLSLAAFYGYKLANGGFHQLLLPTPRLRASDTAWGVPGLDRVITHTGSVGAGFTDSLRNLIATITPAFTDYGWVVARRLPFLLPSLALAALVALALRLAGLRRLIVLLVGVAAIASGSGLFSLRPRVVLPGSAIWAIGAGAVLVVLLREQRLHRSLVAGIVVAVACVNLALGYSEAARWGRIYDADLYGPGLRPSPTSRALETQRRNYRCRLLSGYESRVRGQSLAERVSLVVSGLRLPRPTLAAGARARLVEACQAASGRSEAVSRRARTRETTGAGTSVRATSASSRGARRGSSASARRKQRRASPSASAS